MKILDHRYPLRFAFKNREIFIDGRKNVGYNTATGGNIYYLIHKLNLKKGTNGILCVKIFYFLRSIKLKTNNYIEYRVPREERVTLLLLDVQHNILHEYFDKPIYCTIIIFFCEL